MLHSLNKSITRTIQIKNLAREMGFDLCGVARAEPLKEEGDHLKNWLGHGYHAGMEWLARNPERRANPTRVLADCRSVIALGVSYYNKEMNAADDDQGGRIARFAVLNDYHNTIGREIKRLAGQIQQLADSPVENKCFVDTGPVLEKAWARRAGLGFIGKNTCLIHPRRGSWFLLGIILTTCELEPDEVTPISCGTCRRCIDACPTGALMEPGMLDARRCLSYWTIEGREAIPDSVKSCLKGWLFGCDLCQEVCPFNERFQCRTPLNPLLGLPALPPRIDIKQLLEITNEGGFRNQFIKDTPLRRAGKEGLLRNALALKEMCDG
ncbi:MAG: tRNA epoxyqueuosine(34) reductase QueG [Calditrichota bacterium]